MYFFAFMFVIIRLCLCCGRVWSQSQVESLALHSQTTHKSRWSNQKSTGDPNDRWQVTWITGLQAIPFPFLSPPFVSTLVLLYQSCLMNPQSLPQHFPIGSPRKGGMAREKKKGSRRCNWKNEDEGDGMRTCMLSRHWRFVDLSFAFNAFMPQFTSLSGVLNSIRPLMSTLSSGGRCKEGAASPAFL